MTSHPPLRIQDHLLYEDRACLVFNKPSGLASQGGSGLSESLENSVAAAFGRKGKKPPRLVHRLDRETSGAILMARTQPAAAFFSAAFAERRAEKTYLAIVCAGAPSPLSGCIDRPLRKVRRQGLERVEAVARPGNAAAMDGRAEGLPGLMTAVSDYQTLAATTSAALLALRPQTGRMHQLRVHAALIGRPIAGDGKYGGLYALDGWPMGRVMLHAWRLSIAHPEAGAMEFTAPPPNDFMAALAALGMALPAAVDWAAQFKEA